MLIKNIALFSYMPYPKTGEPAIDWPATKAIHLKMHGIYLHPKGLAGNWRRGTGPGYMQGKTVDEIFNN